MLNQLKPVEGARHAKKRLGRGIGSGLGKTAGKGTKGQNARLVAVFVLVLKVDNYLYSNVYQKEDSRIFLVLSTKLLMLNN